MWAFIEHIYAPFFELKDWQDALFNPTSWMIIASLIVMECLLSVDNAVVLAAQTKSLPTESLQRKSLIYGLGGAYIFRFLIIGVGTYLIHMWFIKVIGAAYLLYLGIRHLYKIHKHEDDEPTTPITDHHDKSIRIQFWRTIVSIELMDIVFSIDSVLASLAMSNNPVVILIGGMVGILAMRGIAEIIVDLMKKIPELETMAYVLILIIAVKLFISIPEIGIDVPDSLFLIIIVGIIIGTVVIHYLRERKK